MPDTYVKVSGSWRKCNNLSTKVSGSWRRCKTAYAKVSGVWRQVYVSSEYRRDIFGDGSCLGLWRLDGNLNGQDGTPNASMYHGDEAYIAGKSGQAFDLRNKRIFKIGGIDYRDVKAWSFWVFKDSSNNYTIYISSTNQDSCAFVRVMCSDDNVGAQIKAHDPDYHEADNVVSGGKDNPPDGWHHIVAQWHYDSSRGMYGSIYIDGSEAEYGYNHDYVDVDYPYYGDAIVGAWYDRYYPYYDYSYGYIDHLRVFNRELSLAEIQTLYHELG